MERTFAINYAVSKNIIPIISNYPILYTSLLSIPDFGIVRKKYHPMTQNSTANLFEKCRKKWKSTGLCKEKLSFCSHLFNTLGVLFQVIFEIACHCEK